MMFNASVIYSILLLLLFDWGKYSNHLYIACHRFCQKCLDESDNIVGEGIAGCQVCNADPNLIFTNNKCECPLPSGFYEHTHHGTGVVTCDGT